jgi:hypothetical protein
LGPGLGNLPRFGVTIPTRESFAAKKRMFQDLTFLVRCEVDGTQVLTFDRRVLDIKNFHAVEAGRSIATESDKNFSETCQQ